MSRYAMCPDCGHRMRRVIDLDGSWDGESYICDYCDGDMEDDYDDDGECLSVSDAADIWLSSGMDEDSMFGYTEEELLDNL